VDARKEIACHMPARKAKRTCDFCFKPGATKICAACGTEVYCDVECQRAEWGAPGLSGHRDTCREMRLLLQARVERRKRTTWTRAVRTRRKNGAPEIVAKYAREHATEFQFDAPRPAAVARAVVDPRATFMCAAPHAIGRVLGPGWAVAMRAIYGTDLDSGAILREHLVLSRRVWPHTEAGLRGEPMPRLGIEQLDEGCRADGAEELRALFATMTEQHQSAVAWSTHGRAAPNLPDALTEHELALMVTPANVVLRALEFVDGTLHGDYTAPLDLPRIGQLTRPDVRAAILHLRHLAQLLRASGVAVFQFLCNNGHLSVVVRPREVYTQ
jgi:hypothetical protein